MPKPPKKVTLTLARKAVHKVATEQPNESNDGRFYHFGTVNYTPSKGGPTKATGVPGCAVGQALHLLGLTNADIGGTNNADELGARGVPFTPAAVAYLTAVQRKGDQRNGAIKWKHLLKIK